MAALAPLIATILSPVYHQTWVGAVVTGGWPLGHLRCSAAELIGSTCPSTLGRLGGSAAATAGWMRDTVLPHNTTHPTSRSLTVEISLSDQHSVTILPFSHRLPLLAELLADEHDTSLSSLLGTLVTEARAGSAIVRDGAVWHRRQRTIGGFSASQHEEGVSSSDGWMALRLRFTNSDGHPPPAAMSADAVTCLKEQWQPADIDRLWTDDVRKALGVLED